MATKSTKPADAAREAAGSILSTSGGPSTPSVTDKAARSLDTPAQQRLGVKQAGTQALAQAQPANALKPTEFGLDNGHAPSAGQPAKPADPIVGSSTVTEGNGSPKTGTKAKPGYNPGSEPLDRVRVDSGGQRLTTNQGVPVGDNQNSLKAGLRGPTVLEDFILREKITHFDHERIPERIVHARGSAAHGVFECYKAIPELTRAAPFTADGKETPVFVRFSTVAGERGSTDTARDVRGFAVKFYTDEGNWDLVGNNMPVFFIQDAMKFPDLIHAVKPEPHHGMPQAASAHDTFWDFISLMPESAHMIMWVMSDRAIPRSYSTMQGFGVHTFRLVNAKGESRFCKFHWEPVAGTHSLVWDEAVKISGADSDFHRRDLWESIEAGVFPQWELGLQVFTEAQAEGFGFDVLDATKLIPEELVPVVKVGKMTLNRNPDNFFAETEQVAFCTAHIVPGIDFSNDPLLQGRIHSYVDTQITRLGGPNFHEIPINSPVAPVHNNQRDGMHRQAIPRGRVSYEPNSLGGGCPFQAGARGFTSFPEPVQEDKVRGKPELFADHYSQAKLFFRSQTPVEQSHIIAALRFELTKVQTQAVRERVVSVLVNIDDALAQGVADGLGIPVPPAQALAAGRSFDPPLDKSPSLSLTARPGAGGVAGLRVALMVADGMDGAAMRAAHAALLAAGAIPRFIGGRLGAVMPDAGLPVHVEVTFETAPAAVWDAVVVPGGEAAVSTLAGMGQVMEFLRDQYRHCKPLLAFAGADMLLANAGIPQDLPTGEPDSGVVMAMGHGSSSPRETADAVKTFMAALATRRHYARELDPTPV
ncbi:MAG: catalase [Burkholderiaceae bacterium]|nr:catalase [Burkholderiaceae bacterium]